METKLKCCKVSVVKGEESTFSWLPNTENTLCPELVINSWLTLNCSKSFSKKFDPENKVKCCKVSVVKGEKSTFSWFPNTENVLF